jgi:hypothetical protein
VRALPAAHVDHVVTEMIREPTDGIGREHDRR